MSEANWRISEKCVVPEEWKAGIGRDFRHYKGKMYRLLGLAPHSETLEPMAVYQLLYGDFGLWVRPAKMFFMVVPRLESAEHRLLSFPWRGADEGLDRLSHRRRNAEGLGERCSRMTRTGK